MMDQVLINDLRAHGIIGVYDWERTQAQEIVINAVLFCDLQKAGVSDDIADCIDYHALALKLKNRAESAARFTVEALAADLAQICLETPGVQKVRLRIEKPAALPFARSAGVEIERG